MYNVDKYGKNRLERFLNIEKSRSNNLGVFMAELYQVYQNVILKNEEIYDVKPIVKKIYLLIYTLLKWEMKSNLTETELEEKAIELTANLLKKNQQGIPSLFNNFNATIFEDQSEFEYHLYVILKENVESFISFAA